MADNFEPLNQDEVDAVECEILDGSDSYSESGKTGNESPNKREFIGADKCAGICTALADIFASRKGDKWKLRAEESEQLGAALDPVLAKYMPSDGEDISAELSLVIVAVAIIVPRLDSGGKV